jgi:hypothetical protein
LYVFWYLWCRVFLPFTKQFSLKNFTALLSYPPLFIIVWGFPLLNFMMDSLYCLIFYLILLNSLCLSCTTLLAYRRSAKFHMLFVAKCLKASCCFISRCLIQQLLQIRRTKFTHSNVLMCKTSTYFGQQWPIIRVQLYETISRPCYHIQYTELCWDHQCIIYRHKYVHWNYKNIVIKVELL